MNRLLFVSPITALLLLPTSLWASKPIDMNPGLWEIGVTTTMQGVAVGPAESRKECVTQDDLNRFEERFTEAETGCKVTTNHLSGNQLKWDMTCDTQQGKITGQGQIKYQRDSFTGGMDMNIASPQMGVMTINSKMEGRRIGPCP